MNIKWNWGTKILVAMILFMSLLIGFVIMSMNQTFYLVEKDYYPKALEFQGMIDKVNNAKQLSEKIKIENLGSEVRFTFQDVFEPKEISGNIVFYRPSDKDKDVNVIIKLDTALKQVYNVSGMLKGKYILKIDYQVGEKGYYQEESIMLNMD